MIVGRFCGVLLSPDGYTVEDIGVDVGVVELFHGICWRVFVGLFEAVGEGWWRFQNAIVNCLWCLRLS